MAAKKQSRKKGGGRDSLKENVGRPQPIPPGATKRALDEIPMPGDGPDGSDLGDRHAAGTPAGGTEVGGLAGTNIGDGSPENARLEEPMGSGIEPYNEEEEDEPPYSGHAGGAVGGTPAEDRATGGRVRGGLRPGGVHRGDSTIGADPEHR